MINTRIYLYHLSCIPLSTAHPDPFLLNPFLHPHPTYPISLISRRWDAKSLVEDYTDNPLEVGVYLCVDLFICVCVCICVDLIYMYVHAYVYCRCMFVCMYVMYFHALINI